MSNSTLASPVWKKDVSSSLVLHLFTFIGAHPQNVLKNPLRLLQIRHGNAKVFQSLHGTKIGLPTLAT